MNRDVVYNRSDGIKTVMEKPCFDFALVLPYRSHRFPKNPILRFALNFEFDISGFLCIALVFFSSFGYFVSELEQKRLCKHHNDDQKLEKRLSFVLYCVVSPITYALLFSQQYSVFTVACSCLSTHVLKTKGLLEPGLHRSFSSPGYFFS